MPYELSWVEPEKFLAYKNINIYHVYEDDEVEQGKTKYWFTASACCGFTIENCKSDPCRHVFDVRKLPTWAEPAQPAGDYNFNGAPWKTFREVTEPAAIRAALLVAIDSGILTADGFTPA